jgi:two-component system cell cycle sensor histidine kinase/response regulator CckA
MDDGSKTREELLLEVDELRRQLAAAREEVHLGQRQPAEGDRQGVAETLIAEPDTPIKILLIEDNPGDARLIREMLTDAGAHGITLEWVSRLSQGLECLGKGEIDLVLLNLSLPDSQGLDTFLTVQTHAPEIPFVVLTGLNDETLALTAVQKGAQDYLLKGEMAGNKLFRAVRYAAERKRVQAVVRRAHDEPERRVEARTTELVAANQQLQEEIAKRQQTEGEQQRLLATVQNYSEELRILNEELKIQGEELGVQNETLNAQAIELEDLTGELQTERNFLQAVLEQMPAGVIIAEALSGRIVLTNRQAAAIFRQPAGALSDIEKFRLLPLYYPDGRRCPPDDCPLWRALTLGETVVDEEHSLKWEDGSGVQRVYLNVSATSIRDRQGSIIAAVATYTDITARKQALAALRQSEERYRSLVELSPDAILVHTQGKIVFVNPAAVKLFGAITRSDLVGQPIMDRMHPDYHDMIQDRIRKVRTGGRVSPLEEQVLRLDGEVVEVEGIVSGIMYQGQSAVQVVFRDITERQRAREALREANEKLRTMIEASPLAIFHVDREGIIQSCNPATERIFGWRTEELLGGPLLMVPDEDREEAQRILQSVFQGHQITGLEVHRRRKDGIWIDVSLAVAPIRDGNGQVTGVVNLAEDITARKAAETALAKSRAEFEAIFNAIADAIIFADSEQRIVLANPVVKTMFGYEPEELMGRSSEVVYANQADFEAVRDKYYATGMPGKPARVEITYRRKDGTLVSAESLASQVRDAQGHILGAVGIHRDITARKVAEAALQESQRQTAMLADLLEKSSQPFGVGFLDGRMGMFNEAFRQLLGYGQEEFSGLNWVKDLTPPEWREQLTARLEELRRTGQPVRFEKEYLRKDGTRVPVEIFVHVRRDDQGRPLHYYAFVTDITARKRAEAALQESEERYRSLFEMNHAVMLLIDSQTGAIVDANPAACSFYGYSQAKLTAMKVTDFNTLPPEQVFEAMQKARDDQQGRFQFRHRLADGETRDVEVFSGPIRIKGQDLLFSIIHDITDRKKAEEGLKQERQRLFALLEELPGSIFLQGEDCTVRFANRRCREIFGDTKNQACYEVFHERQAPCAGCPSSTIIETQTFQEFEKTIADGRTFQIYKYPFRDIDGSPCVLSLGLDITARKQTELALRESEEKFLQLAENLDDAILLASADLQRVYYISPAFERIWGRSCASLYQEPRSWFESVVSEDRQKVNVTLKKLVAGKLPVAAFPEFRINLPDGTVRWILTRFFPINNEAGEVYRIAGIATDITSRKEVETVLHWRQEHLQQAAKMEAVGRLAGGVAHDFNNLLTVMTGYGELLLTDLGEPDPGRQHVQAILKAADQATVVTRQLLAFSRKQVLQPQTFNLNELVASLVDLLKRLIDENIEISMALEPELGAVKADPSHMEQVVMNLAINALDAMPEGGVLIIETANVQLTPDDVRRHPDISPGSYVMLAVRDTGIGMRPEILSHIFEPFFTTKERGKGTGLGLSTAYGIIKQSGGHILAESIHGQGSCFRIYLPRAPKAKKPTAFATPALADVRGPHIILLVEDEPEVRHVVQSMLALKGYVVLTASDGQEALKIGQSHKGPIHLLLTDVAMPVMGGRELAERLTSSHREMKVLFMSGHTEDGIVRRGIRESAINFIQKPFRADRLLRKVEKLLREEKP